MLYSSAHFYLSFLGRWDQCSSPSLRLAHCYKTASFVLRQCCSLFLQDPKTFVQRYPCLKNNLTTNVKDVNLIKVMETRIILNFFPHSVWSLDFLIASLKSKRASISQNSLRIHGTQCQDWKSNSKLNWGQTDWTRELSLRSFPRTDSMQLRQMQHFNGVNAGCFPVHPAEAADWSPKVQLLLQYSSRLFLTYCLFMEGANPDRRTDPM